MTHVFARQGPSRSLFDYAKAMQDDGIFDESNRAAWDDAYTEWTDVYGKEIFLGLNDVKYQLSCTEDELAALAKENGVPLERQRGVWEQNVKMVNYRFWQHLADCERDQLTVEAHRAIYAGKVAYSKAETLDSRDENGELQISNAQKLFEEGMAKLAQVMEKYPNLAYHDAYIEEGMLAVHYWTMIHEANIKEVPADYPLKDMVLENAARQMDIQRMFQLEVRQGL